MPILLFFIFVVLIVLLTLALGYGLSSAEGRSSTRRCRMSREMHRRRNLRKQRVQCRFSELS